jgi:hypothetical protein
MNWKFKNLGSIVINVVIAALGAVIILNYKNFVLWKGLDHSFEVDQNFEQTDPTTSSGSIQLYSDFVMTASIDANSIRDISHRIQLEGKLSDGFFEVEAAPTNFGTDTTRIHTVYFYVDDGKTGGHLEARRVDSRIVEGGFKIGDPHYSLNINAKKFVVARGSSELKEIRFIDIMNDQQPHWVGSFVATGIYGVLENFVFHYTCDVMTPDCKIKIIN